MDSDDLLHHLAGIDIDDLVKTGCGGGVKEVESNDPAEILSSRSQEVADKIFATVSFRPVKCRAVSGR